MLIRWQPCQQNSVRFLDAVSVPHYMFFIDAGSKKRTPFFLLGQEDVLGQASAVWRWSNFLHQCVPEGKVPLRCNLDETSIKLFTETARGCVSAAARMKKYKGPGVRRKIQKGHTRGGYSHVCLVCDNEVIQKQLPQIVVVNEHMCPLECYKRLAPQLPGHIKLWRRKSSWLNIPGMCDVIKALGQSLGPYRKTYQPILCLDACKVHLNAKVWRTAKKWDILMFCIPAKITYCLQPLDVYVFSNLKAALRQHSQTRCIASASGGVSLESSVLSLSDAITTVLNGRSWAHAFEHLGLCGSQTFVSGGLLKQLHVDGVPNVEPLFPTLEELFVCFPKRLVIPIDDVFGCVAKFSCPQICDPPEDEAIPVAAGPSVSAWHGRTRSTSSTAVVLSAPPPLPPPAEPDVLAASCPAPTSVPRLRRLPSTRSNPPAWP